MPFFDQFPYTNFHEINLDWIIKTVKLCVQKIQELDQRVNEELEQEVVIYINEHMATFLLTAAYVEAEEAIRITGEVE